MLKTFVRMTMVGTFALAAAACGGSPTNESSPAGEDVAAADAQPAAEVDPCSFVGKEDITAVTGEKILQTKADGQTCRYETDDEMASSVQVDVKSTGGKAEMDAVRSATGTLGSIGEDLKGEGGAKGATGEILAESGAAPKIGDQSFFGANSQLHVLKGDTYFAVLPPTMRSRISSTGNPLLSSEQKREMAAAIAQKIAAKL
jgi:hypothetical protein